jgi:hypothetical protein
MIAAFLRSHRPSLSVAVTSAAATATFFGVGSSIMGTSSTKMAPTGMTSFYDITATKSDGSQISMSDFRGKVVYATNVASK